MKEKEIVNRIGDYLLICGTAIRTGCDPDERADAILAVSECYINGEIVEFLIFNTKMDWLGATQEDMDLYLSESADPWAVDFDQDALESFIDAEGTTYHDLR